MENNIEQRSEEWYELRKGKFTASEIYKLMGIKGLGETGKSYAFDKAIEELYGEVEESFDSYDMQRGRELEPLAFKKFKELKEFEFLEVTNCGFFVGCEHSGSSPDGLVSDNSILEIKCPKASTFFKLVSDKVISPNYFYQMQKQMKDTKRSKAYFFNYIVLEGIEYWHCIEVLKDKDIIDKMDIRISEAVEIKKDYINKITINKQF